MQYKVIYRNENGYSLSDIVECDYLDEVRVTAFDEIPGCIEIEDIVPIEVKEVK